MKESNKINQDLEARIERLSNHEPEELLTAGVRFECQGSFVKKINEALGRASEEDRFTLTMDLFGLWKNAGIGRKVEQEEEAKKLFGKTFEENGHKQLIYTLTSDGRQFRVWYGSPANLAPKHAESSGKNLLFGIYGHPERVQQYIQSICKVHFLDEIVAPNGVRIYMLLRYR